MEDVSVPNRRAPESKQPDKKTLAYILIAVCGVGMISFIFATAFTSKKPISTNQPNGYNQTSSNQPTQTQTQTQAVQPLPQINTITLTKNGFTPAKTMIKKGTAVKWINNSGTDNASVNSDDYPTNLLFPELNLGKINQGSAVAHIFTTAGTYTYHNQFNPKQKGTIVVE